MMRPLLVSGQGGRSSSRTHLPVHQARYILVSLVILASALFFIACCTGIAVIRISSVQQIAVRQGAFSGGEESFSSQQKQPEQRQVQQEPDDNHGVSGEAETLVENSSREKLLEWWTTHPDAPIGLSCDSKSKLIVDDQPSKAYAGLSIPPPLFQPRTPTQPLHDRERVQVAMVIPFVPFQLQHVVALLSNFWRQYRPCLTDTPLQSADLVFFTESNASERVRDTVRYYYEKLAAINATACFHSPKPIFLSLDEVDAELSHLEGAAYSFFSLFSLLESKYETFFLAEPDVAPVQSNFVPALVEQSRRLFCGGGGDGLWQMGSLPLVADIEAGMLRDRVDYHMNGNALYVLGCPEFEDYRCRMQTYYVPKDECSKVAGCGTHEAYEGGYDHAMYRFRMHPDNYEYSRLVLHRFAYSNFLQNRGEAIYLPTEVVSEAPSTYFVHSKSIFVDPAATVLKEATVSALRRDVCIEGGDDESATRELASIYFKLQTREYAKADAVRHLCRSAKEGIFGEIQAVSQLCSSVATAISGTDDNRDTKKTTIGIVGGAVEQIDCDVPIVVAAGGIIRVAAGDGYKNGAEALKGVDAVLCMSLESCKSAMELDRVIIVHASTLLLEARRDSNKTLHQSLIEWFRTLKDVFVLVNNAVDHGYIHYYAGFNATLIQSWCGDNTGIKICDPGWESILPPSSAQSRQDIIVLTSLQHSSRHIEPLIKEAKEATAEDGIEVTLSQKHDPKHILDHSASIVLPLSMTTREFKELYRLNIPLFCPSLALLRQWHRDYNLELDLGEANITFEVAVDGRVPDPRDLVIKNRLSSKWEIAFNHWMLKQDAYIHEYITYFDTWDEFLKLYTEMREKGPLESISRSMLRANSMHRASIVNDWKILLERLKIL